MKRFASVLPLILHPHLIADRRWLLVLRPQSLYKLGLGKEKSRLSLSVLIRVRGMNRVPLLGLGVELPNGPGLCLSGIGCTDGLPKGGDRIISLQHDRHAPAGGHELGE